jgi:hypothetical protein
MPIQTDLNVAPYYDDYADSKNYYKILFRPGVAVQARELNQLQTMLQKQVERFGDNIFRRGTIIDGCLITYHNYFPFVKIKDIESDGAPVNVLAYNGLYVKNSSNLQSVILKTISGFESRNPDLNTLYVHYINSGISKEDKSYAADEVLTVFNNIEPISKIRVYNGAANFSNVDTVVILSALAVQNSSGGTTFSSGFNVGDKINNGLFANAEIVSINATANSSVLVLGIKALKENLNLANSQLWTFSVGDSIVDVTTSQAANVASLVGSGATATLVTDSVGQIATVAITSGGLGYYVNPYVSVSSTTATTTNINTANLIPQTYLTQITIAGTATTPVGSGYGMSVDEGVIYQKGYFSRVEKQTIVVEKYGTTTSTPAVPDNVVVGFNTAEEIVTSSIDPSLLDNASGTFNEAAPGANRLKLTPYLTVLSKEVAEANNDFLAIAEFSGGEPYKQARTTQYNAIGNEIAKRTYEESGDYVLDHFYINTKSNALFSNEATSFNVVVDPGKAYIQGFRVETFNSYIASVTKATDTEVSNTATISFNYGNYILVNELGGLFNFKIGDLISLYSTAKTYLTNVLSTPAITAPTGLIGAARIRSLVLSSGTPGTPNCLYKLYLFDVKMTRGSNIKNVKSVYYDDGTYKGVADTSLVKDPSSGVYINIVYDNNLSAMTFPTGVNAMKNANNISYTYRTQDIAPSATAVVNTAGFYTKTLSTNETFPYSGTLTAANKTEILYIPLANVQASVNISGNMTITTTSNAITGVATGFLADLRAGDYIKVANAIANVVVRVASIASNTSMQLTANGTAAVTSGNAVLFFPQNVPVSLERDTRVANISSDSKTLTISLGTAVTSTATLMVGYNVKASNVQFVSKTPTRNAFVRLKISNNAVTNVGPWPLGVSDIFRLKGVYKSTTQTLTFSANTNVNGSTEFITVANNCFSNGDSVLYTVPVSNTAIPGISNNTSYYVVYANTLGFALSLTSGGANINITASANLETHSFTGIPLYFTPTTASIEDVTNEFYIDHNQNENYYDTSYLYQKPKSTLAISTSEVYLVKYDTFVTASEGIKHVKSYPIDDTMILSALNASGSINTLEIPEMYDTKGGYHDLRDEIDLRPVSNNTSTITTSAASATINPAEPAEGVRFSVDDKKFPVPDSSLTAVFEHYLSRVDSVIVNSSSDILILTGVSGSNIAPETPPNGILINNIVIPPYPSIPSVMSTNTILIADTMIANEKYAYNRLKSYTVNLPSTSTQQVSQQPRGYTMSDIGQLERRIKDLEYYVSFTLAEAQIKGKVIPSSNDGTLDRFKFGFFVDAFSDYNYADTTNPEYYADISNGRLHSKVDELVVTHAPNSNNDVIGPVITFPYSEYVFVSQTGATNGPVTSVAPPTVTGNPSTVCTQWYQSIDGFNATGLIYEEREFHISSTAGAAQLTIGTAGGALAIEVFYGIVSGFSTSSLTPAYTAASFTVTGGGAHASSDPKPSIVGGGAYLSFTTTPSLGRYIKIRITKYRISGYFSCSFCGPIDNTYVPVVTANTTTANTTTANNVTPTPVPSIYKYGTVTSITPPEFTIQTSNIGGGTLPAYMAGASWNMTINVPYIQDSQAFVIKASGLRADSRHYVFFDSKLVASSQLQQTGKTLGAPLITGADGSISFTMFYDAGIENITGTVIFSDFARAATMAAAAAGTKSLLICDTPDAISTSFTASKIIIKNYVRAAINNQVAVVAPTTAPSVYTAPVSTQATAAVVVSGPSSTTAATPPVTKFVDNSRPAESGGSRGGGGPGGLGYSNYSLKQF